MPDPRNLFLFCILFLTLFTGLFAQQPKKDTIDVVNVRYAADLHYFNQDYDLALTEYRKLYTVDSTQTDVNQQLANCYQKLNNPRYTEIFLRKVIAEGERTPANLYYYSWALRALYRLEEYKEWSLQYAALYNANRDSLLPKPPNWEKDLSNDRWKFEVVPMASNGPGTDFSPSALKYGWLFPSAGPKAGDPVKIWYANGDKKKGPEKGFKVKGKASKIWTDGPVGIASEENVVYFTGGGDPMKGENTQIYRGIWSQKKNKILKIEQMDLGPGAFAHPVITVGEDLMYFASTRPGGQGGWDLWRIQKADGVWGEPENLGPEVNSEADEMYPWVIADRTLFFSSNRSGGLGGMDMYVAKPVGAELFQKPEPLPAPLNSSADDIGQTPLFSNPYYTHLGVFKSYFTSNREGDWNVYQVRKRDEFTGFARKHRRDVKIPGAIVLVEGKDGSACLTRTDAKGSFQFYMESSLGYDLRLNHPEFNGINATNVKMKNVFGDFKLHETEYYDFKCNIYDRMNFRKLVDARIEIIENEKDTSYYQPDTLANLLVELEPGNAYKVKVSHPGYFDWTRTFTAYKGKQVVSDNTLKMERKIGTLVRGKLDAPAGTDFSNTRILTFIDGEAAEPLAPSVVNPDGKYEVFLRKDQTYKLYITLDGLLSGSTEVRTNQNGTSEMTDTVDLFLDVKRAQPGSVLFTFGYEEDPIRLQAGAYVEMKETMSLLEAFPEMKLEFAAHTETRRPSGEARRYSQEAAEFGADYYHYREVPKNRMVAKGYGGTQPLINCRTRNCSDTEHKKNRRIEIRVLDTGK